MIPTANKVLDKGALSEALRVAALTILVLGATLLPHAPGRHDLFAATLSMMARTFGVVALILVPVGVLWLVVRRHYLFARIAIVTALLPCIAAGVIGLALGATSAGILAIVICGIALLVDAWPAAARLKDAQPGGIAPMAVTLIVAPLLIFALQRVLVPPAVEFARNRAIANSAAIIADIERYRAANGVYPQSLLAEWGDYNPGVIGIERYHYERHGDAYNLIFENPALAFGTREFVVYNPRDEQVFTAHASDILRLSPDQLVLERTRGHYAVNQASQPHWKFFWFD